MLLSNKKLGKTFTPSTTVLCVWCNQMMMMMSGNTKEKKINENAKVIKSMVCS
jgi:hypothetical protein